MISNFCKKNNRFPLFILQENLNMFFTNIVPSTFTFYGVMF